MFSAVPTRKNPTIPSSRYVAPTTMLTVFAARADASPAMSRAAPISRWAMLCSGIDLEDAEQQSALGRDESDSAGDGEAEKSDEDVDRAEDRGDEAVR